MYGKRSIYSNRTVHGKYTLIKQSTIVAIAKNFCQLTISLICTSLAHIHATIDATSVEKSVILKFINIQF